MDKEKEIKKLNEQIEILQEKINSISIIIYETNVLICQSKMTEFLIENRR